MSRITRLLIHTDESALGNPVRSLTAAASAKDGVDWIDRAERA